MDTIDISKQDELEVHGGNFLASARVFVIDTPANYTLADELRQSGRAHKKKVDAFMDPLIKTAHATHKALTTAKNDLVGPAIDGIKLLGDKMEAYDAEQKRIAEVERKRLEDEANAKAKKEAEEELLAAAVEAEAAGDKEEAEALMEEAKAPIVEPVYVPPAESTTPKVSTSYRTTYYVDRTNYEKKLIPLEYMEPNFSAMDAVARSTKGAVKIAGMRILEKRTPVG